eukprot:1633767-Prorocentrum_lima.AAC.1
MTSSLVGSEMCIRDSGSTVCPCATFDVFLLALWARCAGCNQPLASSEPCLLYTSDAADDM